MKILFVPLYAATPHFETELELIADLLQEGHQVNVLRCSGTLTSCLINPAHATSQCLTCISKIDGGLRAVAHPNLRVEALAALTPAPPLALSFPSVDELLAYESDGANLGRGVYSSLCSRFNKNTRFDTRIHAEAIRTELRAAQQVYLAVKDALTRLRPDRVYVFNGRFSTMFPILEACRQAGVDYWTHERGGTPGKYLVRRNALPHDFKLNHDDILAVWAAGGAEKADIARAWYERRRSGQDKSWESYTKAQTVGKLPDGFDAGKRNIAIFNSTMEEYASIRGCESRSYPDEAVGVCRVVESLRERRDVHVYLRVHPNLKNIPRHDNYQLSKYQTLEGTPNLTIIWPESPIHTYALLDASNVALTFGSTMGVEATFWKRPSVMAGRSVYENLGCAYVPQNHDEVLALLLGELAPKPDLGALQYAYWETACGAPFKRFKPIGLYQGEFEGRPCRPSLPARIQSRLLQLVGR